MTHPLVDITVYNRGLEPLADRHLVYAGISADPRPRNGQPTAKSRIVEIGKTDKETKKKTDRSPIDRLLMGKQENLSRLLDRGVPTVQYIELMRVDHTCPLTHLQIENVVTRLFAIALGMWPIGNQLASERTYEKAQAFLRELEVEPASPAVASPDKESSTGLSIPEAFAFCSDAAFSECRTAVAELGDTVFRNRWNDVVDIFGAWDCTHGGVGIRNDGCLQGRRHKTRHGAHDVPLGVSLIFKSEDSGLQILSAIDKSLYKHTQNWSPLAAVYAVDNSDNVTDDELALLERLSAIIPQQT